MNNIKKERNSLQLLWRNEYEYSKTLQYALMIQENDNASSEAKDFAKTFIDNSIENLILTPDDVVKALIAFESDDNKVLMLKKIVESELTKESLLFSIISNKDVIAKLPLDDGWLNYPVRAYAKHQMETKDGLLDINDLIPEYVDINKLTAEYIISWAFEENRLSANGCDVFKSKFPNKYEMLLEITEISKD